MVVPQKTKVSKKGCFCPLRGRRNIKRMMSRIFLILSVLIALMFAASGCSPKVIYVKGETEVVYRDSIVTKIDSVEVPLPVEVIKEVAAPTDTLEMETSLAKAKAWVDTASNTLRGEIKNKPKSLPVPVEHKEEFHQKDSIQKVEVPVPYEVIKYKVPKWCWWILGIAALLLAMEVLKIFMEKRIF